jgi:hypothetical protein
MLFDAGQPDALQQGIWQYFWFCIGGTLWGIGVQLAEIYDANTVGVSKSITKLFASLQ